MANAIWQRNIVDGSGTILPGATVAVFDTEGGSLVTLYDGDDVAITNPVVADANGYAFFYAPPGKYYLRVVFGPSTTPYPDVLVGTTADDGVSTLKILDANVTEAKIATGAVTEDKIGAGAVTRAKVNKDIVTQVADITELRALTGMVDGQAVEVFGYSAAGGSGGGGMFFWDLSRAKSDHNGGLVFSPSVPWSGDPADLANFLAGVGETDPSGNGCWVRQTDGPLTPYHFGAVAGADCAAALMKLFDGTSYGYEDADVAGEFTTNQPIYADTQGFKRVRWSAGITADTSGGALSFIVAIKSIGVQNTGALALRGSGSAADWSSWAVDYGLVVNGIQSGTLPRISSSKMRFAGVVYDEPGEIGFDLGGLSFFNNTAAKIENVYGRDIGGYNISPAGNNLGFTATYSNPVRTGSAGSSGQYTTLDVSQVPHDGDVSDAPCYAVIGDNTFRVTGWDSVAGTIDVSPWVPNADISGDIYYIFGAAAWLKGSNGGPSRIGGGDMIRCAIAVQDSALYGVDYSALTAQFCGIASVIGSTLSSAAPVGTIYDGFYSESVWRNVVFQGAGSGEINGRNGGFAGEAYKDCEVLTARGASDADDAFYVLNGFKNLNMPSTDGDGISGLVYKGRPENRSENISSVSLSPAIVVPRIYKRNSWTISLQDPGYINWAKGLDTIDVTFFGTGASNEPTGSFTFNPPSGWTVNGGANYVSSGFAGPVRFLIYYDYNVSDILVIEK